MSTPDARGEASPVILTPDQRLRVFVSSTLGELAPEREAARRAIERVGLVPVMFEIGARPHPPRALYRAYLEQSQIFVGIYWQRYGWVAPGMEMSGLEDEFRLSEGMPRLVYVKGPSPDREPGLSAMLHELADQAQVSYKHVERVEELEAALADDLAVLLSERFAARATAPAAAPTLEPAGLPVELSSFVGRQAELTELHDLLARERLVTLTGIGGCGKTRLALRAAAELRDGFPEGVAWVDLAPITDEALVPLALASALGLREMPGPPLADQIVRRLAERRQLVVLDNCEHLLGGCAELVARVLRGCPGVTVLTTSREPLAVEGEVRWRVPMLAVPGDGHPADVEDLRGFDAVRLFVDRANRVHPHFALSEANAAAVAEICRALDGLPLAIELAAARTRMLTPEQIAAGLTDRFRLLTGTGRGVPTRQQSLLASIDWSYDLLGEDEQVLLRRLSVFSGSFGLALAAQVCTGHDLEPDAVLDLLAALVDRSLVQVEEHALAARFRLLQTIRDYARERLVEAGEERETCDRHLVAYVALVERLGPDLEGPGLFEALDELDAALGDLRAALAWSVESEQADRALAVIGSGWHLFLLRGYVTDDRRLLEAVLATAPGATAVRARALYGYGQLAFEGGDVPAMQRSASEALDLARRLDDRAIIARSLGLQGWCGIYFDPLASRRLLDESTALAREVGDWWCVAESRAGRAMNEWMAGDIVSAAGAAREAVEAATRCGSAAQLTMADLFLGMALTWQGDLAAARSALDEALATNRRLRNTLYIGYSLAGVVAVEVYSGRYDAALAAVEEMLALARDYPGTSLQATALYVRGFHELAAVGDLAAAAAHVQEALTMHRAAGMGDSPDAVECLHLLGDLARRRGDLGSARRYLDECLVASRALASPWTTAGALDGQARLLRAEGDTASAWPLALEALDTSVVSANRIRAVDVLETVVSLAIDDGWYEPAARLHAAVEATRQAMGYVRFPSLRPDDETALAQMREALGDEGYAKATAAGTGLGLDGAAKLARSLPPS